MQYEIIGGSFPAVVCHLQGGEAMKNESGSMIWMDANIQMTTTGGGGKKMLGRLFSGESLFMNVYTANGDGKIAFGSSFPGRILPVQISPGHELVVQKSGFLASEMGVDLSVHINQKIAGGVFGGEGFIMQRLSGNGIAFIECDGEMVEYDLAPGQQIIVDTGNVLAFSGGVQLEIQRVKGVTNIVFGGEGLFNTVLTGPGKVWLQTMPICNVAGSIQPYIVTGS
ncbi:MAG: TIGR00266 family protein [Coriobacteriia bacterium]|nr:TIGR00266 family protein [Coriobacteriia bacterium]